MKEPELAHYRPPTGLVQKVSYAAKKAGDKILQLYKGGVFRVDVKPDQSPVTDADRISHQIIIALLEQDFSWKVISEEGNLVGCDQVKGGIYWLVDPLDGTREFISRTDDFSVNIALIVKDRPVFGVIYSPVSERLYYAQRGQGSFRAVSGGSPVRIYSRRPFDPKQFTVIMSRRHTRELPQAVKRSWPGCIIRRQGSALKFCSIAEGSADLYIRTGPTSLWDTAAGQIILEEAGGKLVDRNGSVMTYSLHNLTNDHFWAIGDSTCQENFIHLIQRHIV